MSLDNEADRVSGQPMDHDAVVQLDECIQRTAGIAGEHPDELPARWVMNCRPDARRENDLVVCPAIN